MYFNGKERDDVSSSLRLGAMALRRVKAMFAESDVHQLPDVFAVVAVEMIRYLTVRICNGRPQRLLLGWSYSSWTSRDLAD